MPTGIMGPDMKSTDRSDYPTVTPKHLPRRWVPRSSRRLEDCGVVYFSPVGAHDPGLIVARMSEAKSPAAFGALADQLAATGEFNHWEEIGAEMERIGWDKALLKLGENPSLRQRLNARCAIAKKK